MSVWSSIKICTDCKANFLPSKYMGVIFCCNEYMWISVSDGMISRDTVLPTFVMLSLSIPTSTWATPQGSSLLHWPTGKFECNICKFSSGTPQRAVLEMWPDYKGWQYAQVVVSKQICINFMSRLLLASPRLGVESTLRVGQICDFFNP